MASLMVKRRCLLTRSYNTNGRRASFFHTLKVEALDNVVLTRDQMRALVFEYIEVDYNRERRHSALGYLSPEKFEIMQAA